MGYLRFLASYSSIQEDTASCVIYNTDTSKLQKQKRKKKRKKHIHVLYKREQMNSFLSAE